MSTAPQDASLAPVRLIFMHTQATSGRLRFLLWPTGLIGFTPLPVEARRETRSDAVLPHPSAPLRDAEHRLGLERGALEVEPEFRATVATPDGPVTVLLARFATIDPPFAVADAIGARFVSLTEIRGLPPIEMALAREAYEVILG